MTQLGIWKSYMAVAADAISRAAFLFFFFFFNIYLFMLCIWLHQVFVVACGIFTCGMWALSCGMQDLVP